MGANSRRDSVTPERAAPAGVPGDLEVTEQKVEAPAFETTRALPLCQWPAWPHYKSGEVARPVLPARREENYPVTLLEPCVISRAAR